MSVFILVCVNYLDLGMYWLYVCLVYNRTNLFQDKYFLGEILFYNQTQIMFLISETKRCILD